MILKIVIGIVGILLFGGLVAAELILRDWSGIELLSLRRRSNTRTSGRDVGAGSWTLPDKVLRERDPHFSETLSHEMALWQRTKGTETWEPTSSGPKLWRLSGPDIDGKVFSVKAGERTVVGQPTSFSGQLYCLGGSTTFCLETADEGTWPSVLQALLNENQGTRVFRARNLGIPGAVGLERIMTFRFAVTPKNLDLAIFLFGDNDSGWRMYGARSGAVHDNLPFLIRQLLRRAVVRSELASWVYGEIAPRYLRRLAVEMAETTIAAAEEAAKFAQSRGANVLFVLQPNIFTLARPDDWDRKIIAGTARDLPIMLAAAYERYREWVADSPIAVDATHLFDGESPSPYMGDWAHVNTRGNQLIGEFIFAEIEKRGLLAAPTSVS